MDMKNLSNNPLVARRQLLQSKRAQAIEEWNTMKRNNTPSTETKPIYEAKDPAVERRRQIQLERNAKLAEQNYLSEASVTALTAFMTLLVESSLMFDLDEFKQYQPTLHEDIKDTVKSFVLGAGIKTNLKNQNTKKLIECIANITSSSKMLTEEEIEKLVIDSATDNADIDKALGNLQYDATDRVAELVQADADRISEINDNIAEIEAINNPDPDEVEEVELADGVTTGDEVNVNGVPSDIMPDDAGTIEESYVTTNAQGQIVIEKRRILKEEPEKAQPYIVERYCEGLVEALAVKEGMALIENGQEYNSDIALGKALTYLTIVEAFNVAGLTEMTPKDYNELGKLAGAGSRAFKAGNIKENLAAIDIVIPNGKDAVINEPPKPESDETPKENGVTEAEAMFDDGPGRNFGKYEDSPMGTGLASQRDGVSEAALRELLFQKYGGAIEDNSWFVRTLTQAGYVKLANGNYVKL